MILLATNKRDVTTDFIVLELQRRELKFHRLNTEDVASYSIMIPGGDPGQMVLQGPQGTIELPEITGAYYRRPEAPSFDDPNASVAAYLQAEWSAVLRSLWNALEHCWLNNPFAILMAEDKPRQLAAAAISGIKVPETLVTNSFEEAQAFSGNFPSIAKPLRHALIDDAETGKVIFTSPISAIEVGDRQAIERAPIILQQEITKRADVRVIVVDDQVFATTIYSQAHDETKTDWRRGVRTDLVHETVTLPDDVSDACIAITKSLGLRFSAIDLIEDQNGAHWFLEANPSGQWAWIEQRTGAQISRAIVGAIYR